MGALDIITAGLRVLLPQFERSDGTIEAKIIDVVASYADSEKVERNNTLEIIREALANQKITTKTYYRRKSCEFQVGDILTYDPINQGGYYEVINEENLIIKQSYITGSYPNWTNLVNAIGTDGHLRPLTADELGAFTTYFDAFQPLGLQIEIQSLDVARISDPSIIIWVRPGTDAGDAAEQISANLLAYEQVFRTTNAVSLSEIEDVIQQYPGVRAVGWSAPVATETQLDGSSRTSIPENGVFNLVNGAFIFDTPITVDIIKTLQ